MMRSPLIVVCAVLLLTSGCSKKPKEVPAAVKAEAAMLISEAQFASSIREYPRAQELVERAIKLRDDVPEYWVTLGMARRKQENKDGARKAYEKALGLHKARYKEEKNPEELGQQAFVLALLGRTDEALKVLDQGLKDHPDSAVMKKMADPRGLPATFKAPKFQELAI
ncbi:MAG TPA: tetratricopeptide repeat protein [Rariglobus sp.]|nr:tetratricopeptide repeat protein [Rariglobus sp.]